MGRIVVALALLVATAVVPQVARLPIALIGCGAASWSYSGRIFPILLRFFVVWLAFYVAVAAGRAWAGTQLSVLILDGVGSLGLALGVAGAVLLIVTSDPAELLQGLDRAHLPREFSYAVLSLVGLLPHVRTVGKRQLALLRLKGIGTGSIVQRLRAYPRIVAPLFGQLLQRQVTHARSLTVRGFFLRPTGGAPGAGLARRDVGLVILLAAAVGLSLLLTSGAG
jgi:energy-coupling factor transporter transmembrane protein EcfT